VIFTSYARVLGGFALPPSKFPVLPVAYYLLQAFSTKSQRNNPLEKLHNTQSLRFNGAASRLQIRCSRTACHPKPDNLPTKA
jgi:hypothetical protein